MVNRIVGNEHKGVGLPVKITKISPPANEKAGARPESVIILKKEQSLICLKCNIK